jgi:hypothetical protein
MFVYLHVCYLQVDLSVTSIYRPCGHIYCLVHYGTGYATGALAPLILCSNRFVWFGPHEDCTSCLCSGCVWWKKLQNKKMEAISSKISKKINVELVQNITFFTSKISKLGVMKMEAISSSSIIIVYCTHRLSSQFLLPYNWSSKSQSWLAYTPS